MNTRELVEFALEKEVMSRRMYEAVAAKIEDDEARMMVLQLAGFEATHIAVFTEALRMQIEAIAFDSDGFVQGCETRPFHLFDDFDQEALNHATIEEILRAAERFEKTMADFYAGLASRFDDEQIRSAGSRLSDEEMSHYRYIGQIREIMGLSLDTHDEEFHGQ